MWLLPNTYLIIVSDIDRWHYVQFLGSVIGKMQCIFVQWCISILKIWNFWNFWNLKSIGLLLQIHNTRCIFHSYSSIVENSQTSFLKINKYLANKCWTLIIGMLIDQHFYSWNHKYIFFYTQYKYGWTPTKLFSCKDYGWSIHWHVFI